MAYPGMARVMAYVVMAYIVVALYREPSTATAGYASIRRHEGPVISAADVASTSTLLATGADD